jgi:hypothetical protein
VGVAEPVVAERPALPPGAADVGDRRACLVAAVTVLPALALGYAMQEIRSSDYVREAMVRVNDDARAVDALGAPIRTGWCVLGSIGTETGTTRADLHIPLRGTQGKGTAHLVAEKDLGQWLIRELSVDVHRTGEWLPIVMPPYECGSASC